MDQDAYEKVCSVCHRPESVAGKLMRLPMNMYLCAECMDRTADMVESQMGNMNGAGAIDWSKVMYYLLYTK